MSTSPIRIVRARRLSSMWRAVLTTVALTVAVPVVLPHVAQAAEVPAVRRLALVDMQRVLNETKAGVRARNELETSSKSKQDKVDKKRKKLEADAGKLKSLSADKLVAAQETLQRESMELQQMMMTLEQELGDQHNKMLEKMYKNASEIVAKVAKEKTIDLVIVRDAMTVIYAKDGLDITSDVVKLYDAKHP
ncbi:MAG: OmpH family outer membrane protein [Deltaproteobacteria bacterium]|nr:OmpH family outer membrane protein [Nannocystaceae bacterium]